jgi:hypothetical protein
MRFPVVSAAMICGTAAMVLVASRDPRHTREDPELHRREGSRLRAHFDSVLSELRARDVSNLDRAQRTARAALVRALARYRDAGVYPHNHDFPGERVPYFRDEHGTLCAMAYLVASTGRDDIVDAIATRRNNAYIHELAADPRLSVWLDSVGLTVREAARIQPAYQDRPPGPVARLEDPLPARYVVASLALGVPALTTTVLNWHAPHDRRADVTLAIGALSGAATAILGAAFLADEQGGPLWAFGIADVSVGTAALVAAVRRSIRHARAGPQRPPVAAAASRFTIDVVPVGHADRISPTARVQIRF